jgi:hypothetical protein
MSNWNWLYMSLETAVFLVFSAASWRIIKRSDTEPVAGPANRTVPARDRSSEVPVLSGQPR